MVIVFAMTGVRGFGFIGLRQGFGDKKEEEKAKP